MYLTLVTWQSKEIKTYYRVYQYLIQNFLIISFQLDAKGAVKVFAATAMCLESASNPTTWNEVNSLSFHLVDYSVDVGWGGLVSSANSAKL